MQFLCSFDALKKRTDRQFLSKVHPSSNCPEDKVSSSRILFMMHPSRFSFCSTVSVPILFFQVANAKGLQYKGHERDSYALASLINEIAEDYLKEEKFYDDLMNSLAPYLSEEPNARPPVQKLLNNELLL